MSVSSWLKKNKANSLTGPNKEQIHVEILNDLKKDAQAQLCFDLITT